MFRKNILLMVTGLISACSLGGGPAPADHYYRLPETVLTAQQSPVLNSIVIKPVKASGLYHERAILFVEKDKPLELQRYHYHFWSYTPSDIVHDALYQGLQSAGIAHHISRALTESRPDYIIETRIIRFERVLDGGSASIELALDVSVSSADARASWSKRYQFSKPLSTADMHSSAEAFGEALQVIVQQFVSDLLNKK